MIRQFPIGRIKMTSAVRIDRLATVFGVRSDRTFQDSVTFKRPTNTKDTVGGVTQSFSATTSNVPCKCEPTSGAQREVANKLIANSNYVIKVPSYFSSALVDVDGRCQAIIAARSGGEPSRTFNVNWVERLEGIEIRIYVSIES